MRSTPAPKPIDAAGADGAGRQGALLEAGDLKRAFARFRADEMPDHAAGLTYYSLLSLFPALLFGAAILGVFGGQELIRDSADYLRRAGADRTTVDAIVASLTNAQAERDTAITALVIGLGTALWGASGAFGAAGRALNVVFRVEEGRGFVRKKVTDIVSTIAVLALALVAMILIFVGGRLAADGLGVFGLESLATLWRIVRWPLALLVAVVIYAVIYFAAPNVKIREFRLITPGAAFGVVMWILASALFFLYVANFSTYSATYGAFAGAVILLVWLWVTNLALLFGAELNAVVDVRRRPQLPDTYDGPPLPVKAPAGAS